MKPALEKWWWCSEFSLRTPVC